MVTPDIHITASRDFEPLAHKIAAQFNFKYQPHIETGLCLIVDEQGLGLQNKDDPKTSAVRVDFTHKAMGFRAQQASIKNEAIARACGLKGNQRSTVLDATAGLARDAYVLASLGATVLLLERSPVVAALLQDGLDRAADDPDSPAWIAQRMQFLSNRSITQIQPWPYDIPDVIYLDPMFPHKKKSALVKKEMRLFQQLLGPDDDADLLLPAALKLAKKRVVVKRPDYAPFLNDQPASMQIKSKKHRFDVYLT
jgi:16S rRNA (guanine1516-N2)-methyltransferase